MIRRLVLCVFLLCSTTLLLQAAVKAQLMHGPWQALLPEGRLRVAFELQRPLSVADLAALHLRYKQPQDTEWHLLSLPAEQIALQRKPGSVSHIVWWDLEPAQALPGLWSIQSYYTDGPLLDIYKHELTRFHVRARPHEQELLRIVVAGCYNYPSSAALERIAGALGGPIDFVLLLGQDLALRLGRGSWEDQTPLIVFSPDTDDERLDILVAGAMPWTEGISFGPLGLVSSQQDLAANAVLSRNQQSWQVYCDPQARWDLGLIGRRDRRSPRGLRLILSALMRRQVPLILSAAHSHAFISEPLAVHIDVDERLGQLALAQKMLSTSELRIARRAMRGSGRSLQEVLIKQKTLTQVQANHLLDMLRKQTLQDIERSKTGIVVQPGGARFVSVAAAGDSFSHLPEEVALPVYEQGLFALQAEEKLLELFFFEAGAEEASQHLRFDQPRDDMGQKEAGWALDESGITAWLEGKESAEQQGAEDLAWVSMLPLQRYARTAESLLHIIERAAADTALKPLLRRFMGLNATVVGEWVRTHPDADPDVRRDWFLRLLAQAERWQGRELADFVRKCSDEKSLRSLLYHIDEAAIEQRMLLLDLLHQRLQLQCAEKVPWDTDPLLQHRVLSHVFLSPLLSQDLALPLVEAALEKVHALGREVLLRYLSDRARMTRVRLWAASSQQDSLLEALLACIKRYGQASNIGAMREGLRQRLLAQLGGSIPWRSDTLGRRLIETALADPRWNQDQRKQIARRLRSQKGLKDLAQQALANSSQ